MGKGSTLLVSACLVAAAMIAIRWALPRSSIPAAGNAPAPRFARPAISDPQLASQVLAHEAHRQHLRQTVWASELQAERHEQVLIDLWDSTRVHEDAWVPIQAFRAGLIEMPSMAFARKLDHDIHVFTNTQSSTIVRQGEWIRTLENWRKEGWRIDGTEWRMPGFRPATPSQPATSRVHLTVHAENQGLNRKAQIEAEIDVTWASGGTDAEPPLVSSARIVSATAATRTGPPFFEMAARDDVNPLRGTSHIDPLIVRDLDGDGLDEVILVGRNRLYLNQGPGRFKGVPFLSRPDAVLLTAVMGDFNGDGHDDIVGADTLGVVLFAGNGTVRFDGNRVRTDLPGLANPYVMSAGDVNGDGHLDLWLAQYKVPYLNGQMPYPYHDANDGFPSYLLINDGTGRFVDSTTAANLGAKRYRRTYAAILVDMDLDGDCDLVNVSDFAGVDLHLNDGHGRFTDRTDAGIPTPKLFGMAAAVADFNGDGLPDLLAIGMNSPVADRLENMGLTRPDRPDVALWRGAMSYGNRTWLNRGGGRFEVAPFARQLAATGWSWGAAVQDFDFDGDLDVYVVNGHKSRPSAREYETEFWISDIYAATSTNLSPALDLYFQGIAGQRYGSGDSYGGHQRNRLLLGDGVGGYFEAAWLLGVAVPDDCRNLAVSDLDGDGALDLILTVARFTSEADAQELRIYRGTGISGGSIKASLGHFGARSSGARVTVNTGQRSMSRWIVSGDGYRTQNPPSAWFGIPASTTAESMTIRDAQGRVIEEVQHPRSAKQTRPARTGIRR
jgi:enediyne biosynthesis protein E4